MNETGESESAVPLPAGDGVSFALSRKEPLFHVWIVLGIGGVMLSALAGNDLWQGRTLNWTALGVTAAAFGLVGGYMAIAYFRALRDRGEQLVVAKEHLVIPAIARRPIPWSAIKALSVRENRQRGSRQAVSLVVHTETPESFGPRATSLARRLNAWWFGAPLVFNLEPLAGEPEDVIEAIVRFAPPEILARSDLRLSGVPLVTQDDAAP